MIAAKRGFTLIELMIVVAIVAILSAVAYPMYQDQIRKAGRAEGRSALLRTAQLEERWYTSSSTGGYTVTLGALYANTGALSTAATVSSNENPTLPGKYLLRIEAVGAAPVQSYLLTADPVAPFTDPDCGSLTLTSTGVRGYTGTGAGATPKVCW